MKFYYIFLLFLLNFKVVAQFDYSCTYNKVETDYDGYYSGRWVDRSDPFSTILKTWVTPPTGMHAGMDYSQPIR